MSWSSTVLGGLFLGKGIVAALTNSTVAGNTAGDLPGLVGPQIYALQAAKLTTRGLALR